MLESSKMAEMRIEQIAAELSNGLNRRSPNNDDNDKRPVLFIASCLGGLILMKALTEPKKHDPIPFATRGVIFLATPFHGTAFENIAYWAKPGMTVRAWLHGKRVTTLAEAWEPSLEITSLARNFTAFQGKHEVLHSAFYETAPTDLLKKNLLWPLNAVFKREEMLVNKETGTLDTIYEVEALHLPIKHQYMNKFEGPEDPNYVSVSGVVQRHLKRIRKGRPLERLDVILREREYIKERLQILRLSDVPLPIDRCYINLTLLEQTGEGDYMSSQGQGAKVSSPFSLAARLGVETPDENIQFKIPDIFEAHTESHKSRKVLIRGCAGVGKTTLCKKIVHDFVHGDLWKGRFDRVFWLPLRELKSKKHDQTKNIEDLIYNQYLSDEYEGQEIARGAWGAMLESGYRNTLFLADGLDEISDELNEKNRLLPLLMELPHVIVTSRPDVTLPRWLREHFSLELEAIGFYPEQVKSYVTQYFEESDIDESEKPEQILSFLQKHQLIQSLMRIPVQLDALCWTWEDPEIDGTQPQTMTDIYCAIESRLWGKDETSLESLRKTVPEMNYVGFSSPAPASSFLERLAFAGMYSNIINFEPENCKNALDPDHRNKTNFTEAFDKVLSKTSFLRSSKISSRRHSKREMRTYHFLHLTFQEFFAARYFISCWKDKKDVQFFDLVTGENVTIPTEVFLGKAKYSTRYNIVWRFVAGLLDCEKSREGIDKFFNTLDKAPLDILGSVHQRVIMHCLSEVNSTCSSLRSGLEDRLSQWLLFQIKLISARGRENNTDVVTLASEIEFPDRVLCDLLVGFTQTEHKIITFNSLKRRRQLSSQMMNIVISLLDSTDDLRLKKCLVKFLGRMQASLPEDTIRSLISYLASKDESLKHSAAMGIQHLTLPPNICREITASMKEVALNSFPKVAAIVLRGQSLPEDVLIDLAATLSAGSREKNITAKDAASDILYHQQTLTPKVMTSIVGNIRSPQPLVLNPYAVKALCGQIKERGKGFSSPTTVLDQMDLAQLSKLSDDLLEEAITRRGFPIPGAQTNQLKAWCSHSRLSKKALDTVVQWLNADTFKRRFAIEILAGQPQLSASILSKIADRLEDDDLNVRNAASHALGHQPSLSVEVTRIISAKFGEKDCVKISALQTFEHRSDSTAEVLATIVSHIGDKEPSTKLAVLNALAGQSELSNLPAIWAEIPPCLQDTDEGVIAAAIQAIGACHPSMLKANIGIIAAQLNHVDKHVRRAAVSVLGKQSDLPEDVVESLVELLNDVDNNVRVAVANCIDRQSIWSEKICRQFALQIKRPQVIKLSSFLWLLDRTMYNRKEFHSNFLLCGSAQQILVPLLLLSFKAQLAWYIVDGESCLEKGTDSDRQRTHVGVDIERDMKSARENSGVPPYL
ncbi:unnamed protein product [Penicillium bialowiezense]